MRMIVTQANAQQLRQSMQIAARAIGPSQMMTSPGNLNSMGQAELLNHLHTTIEALAVIISGVTTFVNQLEADRSPRP